MRVQRIALCDLFTALNQKSSTKPGDFSVKFAVNTKGDANFACYDVSWKPGWRLSYVQIHDRDCRHRSP